MHNYIHQPFSDLKRGTVVANHLLSTIETLAADSFNTMQHSAGSQQVESIFASGFPEKKSAGTLW